MCMYTSCKHVPPGPQLANTIFVVETGSGIMKSYFHVPRISATLRSVCMYVYACVHVCMYWGGWGDGRETWYPKTALSIALSVSPNVGDSVCARERIYVCRFVCVCACFRVSLRSVHKCILSPWFCILAQFCEQILLCV